MSKETPEERTQKAFKAVERGAKIARASVIMAQRKAIAVDHKKAQEDLARRAKAMKRSSYYNSQIAEALGVSESTVRALLMMKIEGEV